MCADWNQTAGTRGKPAPPPVPSPDGNNERQENAYAMGVDGSS